MSHEPVPAVTVHNRGGAELDTEALQALAQAQGIDPLMLGMLYLLWMAEPEAWVAMARLVKRLGSSGSAILRMLAPLGAADSQNPQGLGWVALSHDGQRWSMQLTSDGRAQCDALFGSLQQPGGVETSL